MSFSRNLSFTQVANLQKDQLFINKLKKDIQKQKVFMAIRDGYVDFYHKGGRLFRYDNNGFQTHIKYAAVIPKQGNDYLTQKALTQYSLAHNFLSAYSRIKENCANYAGLEALGVSELYHKYSYLSNNDIVVLDIEISLKSTNTKNTQDRIDILLFNKKTQELKFVEAKHYTNSEIRSTAKPKVVSQINRYEKQILKKQNDIIHAYRDYITRINQIFKLKLPHPKTVRNNVKLLIFGFDKDQRNYGLKKIKNDLKNNGVRVYSIGNMHRFKSIKSL